MKSRYLQAVARRLQAGLFVWSAILPAADRAFADDSGAPGQSEAAESSESSRAASRKRKVTDKTLGGRQFWADVEFFHGWRIQQHVHTKHFRLLDDDDYRCATGTLEECRERLEAIRKEQQLPPMSGEAVILVHGLVRSSKSMHKLERHLGVEQAGFRTFSFDYPSTQVDIGLAADYLHRVIGSLEGIERIHFVAHSMGGLVVRRCLAEHPDPRLGRVVMIATPNLGADLADRFHRQLLFRALFGTAGQQLTGAPEGFIVNLPMPDFEFGVIAGGRGNDRGYNPLIPGDDDGTVSVACTRLPGAADFAIVDRLHTFLIVDQSTCDYTLRFLKKGRFREEEMREAIAREPEAISSGE